MTFLNQNIKKNKFGLLPRDIDYLISGFQTFNEIEKAMIFGSRAMGNYKNASDIDIAIFGKNIGLQTVSRLYNLLNEELSIPYFIDVVHFETIKNKELKEHILNKGKIIYQKKDN